MVSAKELIDSMLNTEVQHPTNELTRTENRSVPVIPVKSSRYCESDVVRLIWNKLPSVLRSKLTLNQLAQFIEAHIDGMSFDSMIKQVGISKELGAALLLAIEDSGLV